MPLDPHDRDRLIRILRLLGSDQPGERAAAALKASELLEALGLDWAEVVGAGLSEGDKVVIRRVRDWDLDHRAAAESRIRQLKSTTERQERQIRTLRTRIATLSERERLRHEGEDIELLREGRE